jgi:hypothetical protein
LTWLVFNANFALLACCSSKLVRFPPLLDLVSCSFCPSLGWVAFSWTPIPLAFQKFVCPSLLFFWFALTSFGFQLGSFDFAIRSTHGAFPSWNGWGCGGVVSSLIFLLKFFWRANFS